MAARQLTVRGVGVILGNLHNTLHIDALRNNILSLLHRVRVHKNVNEDSIEVFRNPTFTYAVVQLRNEPQRQYVMSALQNKRMLDGFSLDGVLQPGETALEVLAKSDKVAAEVTSPTTSRSGSIYSRDTSRRRSDRFSMSSGQSRGLHDDQSSSGSNSKCKCVDDPSSGSINDEPERKNSNQDRDKRMKKQNKEEVKEPAPKRPESNSKRGSPVVNNFKSPLVSPPLRTPPKFCMDEVLTLGQFVGSETRILEFKAGGGRYLHSQVITAVSKYVCSFLNSEGGTLLIGVNDNGYVVGTECDHRLEDLLRTQIDDAIKFMSPHVFPCMYSVTFIQVLDEHGEEIADRKVLEVTVQPGNANQLYETKRGDVFIRRDGSVQGPLRASQIQEWTKMMVGEDNKKKEVELRELSTELARSRQNEKFLKEQLEELCDSNGQVEDSKLSGKRKRDTEEDNQKSCTKSDSFQSQSKKIKRVKSHKMCTIV